MRAIEEDDIESKWITVRPKQLSRDIPILIVGAIYHPPNNDTVAGQYAMVHDIQTSLECYRNILKQVDMNQLKTSALTSRFHLKQIVDVPTRGKNNLDKILTNMGKYYNNPFTIGKLGHQPTMLWLLYHPSPQIGNHLRRSLSQVELLVMAKYA